MKNISILLISTFVLVSCFSKKKSKIDFEVNKAAFQNSLQIMQDISVKINKLENDISDDSIRPFKLSPSEVMGRYYVIFDLNDKGILESSKVTDEYLDYIHPELKNMYRNNLIAANKLKYQFLKESLEKNITYQAIIDIEKRQKFITETANKGVQISEKTDKMFREWNDFNNKNYDKLTNKSILLGSKPNKSYWKMLFFSIIGDIVVTILYSLLVYIILGLTVGIAKISELSKSENTGLLLLLIPQFIFSTFVQVYFWILWAAFCAFNVIYFLDSPNVTHNWLYYLTGFLAAGTPMAYLSNKEQEYESSSKAKKKISNYSLVHILISTVGYVVLCISPKLMNIKYISFINDWLT